MDAKHLTATLIEAYVENELEETARAQAEQHLGECATCRARVARSRRVESALRALPRVNPPQDFAARIAGAAEAFVEQERVRRGRMPFIAVALGFSALLCLWFAIQILIALEENGTLYLFSLLSSYPDALAAAYSTDVIVGVIETLPLGEIVLTLFALFTVIVLAHQWVDTMRPRAPRISEL
jgi:predicted anti-sigma-YlaC factor YlaD